MDDHVIEASHSHGVGRTSPLSSLDLWFVAGRASVHDPGRGPLKRARYLAGIEATFEDPREADRHIGWARAVWRDLSRFGDGIYLNFAGFGEERDALLRSAFGDDAYERLRRLKRRYDPTNVFRSNMNIPP
jgi:hypothetical protein